MYGTFALMLAVVTGLLLVGLLLRLAAHRLPASRWSRAWRFAVPGAALGLTLTMTTSTLRLLVPSPTLSFGFVLVLGAVGMVFGYLSPEQDDGSGRDDLDERDLVRADEADEHAAGRLATVGAARPSSPGHAQPAGAAAPSEPLVAPPRRAAQPGDPAPRGRRRRRGLDHRPAG